MAVSIRDDVGLLPRLHGTTFATRCWASEAAWDSRAFNGDVAFSEAVGAFQQPPEHGGARLASDVIMFGQAGQP